jgi:hypothetical protein
MRLVPYAYRPSVVVRRNAVRRGLFGPSILWKVVAAAVFGRSTLKKFFGKQPEKITTERLKPDTFLTIITATPMSRRERQRSGITRARLIAQAEADVRAANRGS